VESFRDVMVWAALLLAALMLLAAVL